MLGAQPGGGGNSFWRREKVIVALIGAAAAISAAFFQFVLPQIIDPGTRKENQNPPKTIEYFGRVVDRRSNQPISRAEISLDFQGAPPVVYTDAQGIYRFLVSFTNGSLTVRLRVQAEGYPIYERIIELSPTNQKIEEIRLSAEEACLNKNQSVVTALLNKPTSRNYIRMQFATVEQCILQIDSIKAREEVVNELLTFLFTDVGTPPVPEHVRDVRVEMVRLINRIKVKDLTTIFSGGELESLDLVKMDFTRADLREVSFKNSFLIQTSFKQAILNGADFTNTHLRNVNFSEASLVNTNFRNADWFNAKGLYVAQLQAARRNTLMQCPQNTDGFHKVLAERYEYPFSTWSLEVQDELVATWQEYLKPNGLCKVVSAWR